MATGYTAYQAVEKLGDGNGDISIDSIKKAIHKYSAPKNEDAEEDAKNDADYEAGWNDDPRQDEDLDVGHQDDEPSMLGASALETAEYAAKLYKKLQRYDQQDGEVDFPNWWQKKLILARDYMSAAYHYLDSEEKQPALDQLALESVVKEGFGTKILQGLAAALTAVGIGRTQLDSLGDILNVLPDDVAQQVSDIIQTAVDSGVLGEAEENTDKEMDENVDRVAGGYPYRVEGNKAVITEPMDDATKERIIKRCEDAGYHCAPNQAGGITITLKKGTYEGEDTKVLKEYASRDFDEIFGALGYRQGFDEFIEDNPGAVEVLMDWIGSISEFRKKIGDEYSKEEQENLGFYYGDDDEDVYEEAELPKKFNNGKYSVDKLQKAHDVITGVMKDLAKKYKAGDKSVVSQLKDLTKQKKHVESLLDAKVSGTGKDQEVTEI